MSHLYKAIVLAVQPKARRGQMNNEKHVIRESLDKRARGEKLTEREARMLAYFPQRDRRS